MNKKIMLFLLALVPAVSWANTEGHYDKAPVDVNDKESLQRGAKYFVNYCLSCHSAKVVRYNRVGADLGMSDDQVRDNLIFTGVKVGETMQIAMPAKQAKQWFGIEPPDLSVLIRARGADYFYTYLRTFYRDPSRPFGVNNVVLPGASMPHVLWELQGVPEAKIVEHNGEKVVEALELPKPGKMSKDQYDTMVGDLVNYLAYQGEPAQLARAKYGPWVLLMAILFTIVAYALKKEYWKDVD